MGLYREQRVLLAVLGWCSMLATPISGGTPTTKLAHRLYCLRVGVILSVLLTFLYLRVWDITRDFHLVSVSYVMWLTSVIAETCVIISTLLANAYNVSSFRALSDLIEHLERTIEERNTAGHVYPPYGVAINALMVVYLVYHSMQMYISYQMGLSVLLQFRWELLIADFYTIQLSFLLLAIGRGARQLKRMLQEAILSNRGADVCAVLRLRDDLVRAVALVNRCYGVFFLGCGVAWVVSITSILYFDFVLEGAFFLDARRLVLHAVTFVWKSALIGGLLMVAGTVMDRVNEIMQATYRCETHPSNNRRLTKMLDKALLKCQFQDINFTVYGLLTIDNSLSYTVIGSIVTYLVILVQFRQVEERIENMVD
ncbi:hypothetical protein ZHAS_00017197 [Anopheles sinensis]|uniref:Gustatory receptor n=1 Tax=Anopheles sinensis TaxID=74873 RepID=A0A084WG52_ANOSI|nr:hypothetical protein ZHAS_00017197 [Anopheles sinensis]